ACIANGIPVGLGTDTGCPFVTPYDMWRELYYFTKYCGVSNAFALHTATQVNAEILGISDKTGTIEIGKSADFIVARRNPLEDISALRTLSMVCARGNLVRNPKVKRIKSIDEALDKVWGAI
ncbi:MAG: amidohydrolase family protein, partial [Lachnospiraceae bacterium]|nr:amidohydrolase family protein [Lachnospiraceae bacterium]